MTTQPRYLTVKPRNVRCGRIFLGFEVDALSRRLFCHIRACRELVALAHKDFETDFSICVEIVSASAAARQLDASLFSPSVSQASPEGTRKQTRFHRSTLNPVIDEELVFDLRHFWLMAPQLRLVVAVVCSAPVAEDDSDCVGCLSFPLEQILCDDAPFPKWYWLLPKPEGLRCALRVEHEQTPPHAQSSIPPPTTASSVRISGRQQKKPFSRINGVYDLREEERHGQRPVFRHRDHGLFLWYHDQRGAWVISDLVGHPVPYAYAEDTAPHPGQIQQPWFVFNQEQQFTRASLKRQPNPPAQAAATFEYDLSVHCRPVGADGVKEY